jgi:parallel beta-helix repeat protein
MRHICTSIVATLVLVGTSFAATINVPADYTTIQAAVDAASNGDEILVAPGTYTGTGDQVVDMLGKAITLRASGTPEQTIIDGEGARLVIACHGGEGTDTVIEGFTITGGNFGGGIDCKDSSSPTISGCTISGNGVNWGFGISCYLSCSPTITNCTISYNNGDGIYCYLSSSPTITDCTISGNYGGASGGGIYCRDNSSPAITNCTISGNAAESGGGIYCEDGSVILHECDFNGNSAANGGAIWLDNSEINATYCVLRNNGAVEYWQDNTGKGGAIYATSSQCSLQNSILSGNLAEQYGGAICLDTGSSLYLDFCDLSENTAVLSGGGIYSSVSAVWSLSTTYCGNSPEHLFGGWVDQGDNVFSDICDEPAFCQGNTNEDYDVDVLDLLYVIAVWGTGNPAGDVTDDGWVNVDDLLLVITSWGACP